MVEVGTELLRPWLSLPFFPHHYMGSFLGGGAVDTALCFFQNIANFNGQAQRNLELMVNICP